MSEGAGHSIAAPSALHQIVQCSGSIVMQQPFPEAPTSEASMAAAEGTAAHWAMAELMAERPVASGMRSPNGVFLTEDMVEAGHLIVDDVKATIEPFGLKLSDCACEVPVEIKRIHDLCWGTPDIRVWLPTPGRWTLVVWDLKFGYRHVEVFENHQLLAYSAGCIDQAGMHDLDVDVINRIVQPRSYSPQGPIREWRYRASSARALLNIMSNAVAEALGPQPRTRVGPACRDCRAAHACETLQRAGEAAMDLAGSAMPHVLDPTALGVELRNVTRMFKLLEARKSALEEQGLALGRAGHRIAHHRMEQAQGNHDWVKSDAEVLALGQMLGLNLAKPAKPITPLQAVKAGLPEALLGTYAPRKPGAAKLVPDDGTQLRRIFSAGAT